MYGLMQDRPLLISQLLTYAAENHGDVEVVSRTVEGPIHRCGYREVERRARRLARALREQGVSPADRIGTLAWNTYRHLEVYYAVSGMGAVCHTINPRLFPNQISYIVNHAEDRYIFTDPTFVPLLEQLAPTLSGVQGFVLMTDRAHMPAETSLPNAICYEDLIASVDDAYEWPTFDERTASSLCYTSGTTGNPKGVLYSHRSTVLHAFAVCTPDAFDLSSRDNVLPVVPMFHANGWGVPYAAPMCGAKITMPGPKMDGASIFEMLDSEKVTLAAGVPTVWLMLLQHMEDHGLTLPALDRVLIGGSAAPRSMIETFQTKYDVTVIHAWGMTEMSPLGTVGTLLPKHADRSESERLDVQVKQGRPLWGVDMKIVGDDGQQAPRDGKTFGHLMVRGPWVTAGYFRAEGGDLLDHDGWFDTGDIATIDTDSYMHITDRSKDVIKSGGEWISSIDLENAAVGHPQVAEAAVIGIDHPKWTERPLLIVVRKPNTSVAKADILEYLTTRVSKWWLPDDIVFVDELPHSATGKILKAALRKQWKDYTLPDGA